ncbi:pyocin knob domain-containing protein [Heyndrickxia sporothermodurans]
MATTTKRYGLLKKDPSTDGNDTFNIKTMLNDNFDKLDEAAKKAELDEHSKDQEIHITAEERKKIAGVEEGAQKNKVVSVNKKTGEVIVDSEEVNRLPDNSKKGTDLLSTFPNGITVMRNANIYDGADAFPSQWGTLVTFKAGPYGFQMYSSSDSAVARNYIRSWHNVQNRWEIWMVSENQTESQTKADKALSDAKTWVQGFGLGNNKTTEITDANNVTNGGLYTVTASTLNIPTVNGGSLIHLPRDTSRPSQIYIDYVRNQLFFRSLQSTGWSSWSSPTDDINLIKSFGIASSNKPITGSLNTLNETGFYYANTGSTDRPVDSNGYVLHQKLSDTYKTQIFIDNSSGRMFKRVQVSGTWKSWEEIPTTAQVQMFKLTKDDGTSKDAPADLNNCKQSGDYTIGTQNTSNKPPTTTYGVLKVWERTTGAQGTVVQMFIDNVDLRTFVRKMDINGVWSDWRELGGVDSIEKTGLGTNSPRLSKDLNNENVTGWVKIDSRTLNAPKSTFDGVARIEVGDNEYNVQTVYYTTVSIDGTPTIYTRQGFSDYWKEWVLLPNQYDIERQSFKTYKSSKDENGIFKEVEQRRKGDNTLAIKSTLSGGTSPKYTSRKVQYYDLKGTKIIKTDFFTLSYDTDGDLISEV